MINCQSNPCPVSQTCIDHEDGYYCLPEAEVDDMTQEIITILTEQQMFADIDISDGSDTDEVPHAPLTLEALKAQTDEIGRYILLETHPSILVGMGYRLDEIVSKCSFDDLEQCQWDSFFHHTYGNCYVFNSNDSQVHISSRPGLHHGFRLAIIVDSNEYLSTTETLGLRTAVGAPGRRSFPDFDGYTILPGYVNVFTLSYTQLACSANQSSFCGPWWKEYKIWRRCLFQNMKMITALGPPYGQCIGSVHAIDPFYYDGRYSIQACEYSHRQQIVAQTCGCFSPKLPSPTNSSLSNCSLMKKSCVETVEQNTSIKSDHCIHSCLEEEFDVTVTKFRLMHYQFKCRNETSEECLTLRTTGVAVFYFGSLTRLYITEVPLYTIPSLLSNIGGIMGLFGGISVITLIELIYIFSTSIIKIIGNIVHRMFFS